jgi:hypothetical protein
MFCALLLSSVTTLAELALERKIWRFVLVKNSIELTSKLFFRKDEAFRLLLFCKLDQEQVEAIRYLEIKEKYQNWF